MSVEHCFKSAYLLMMLFNMKRVKIHTGSHGQNQEDYYISNFIMGLFCKHKIKNAKKQYGAEFYFMN